MAARSGISFERGAPLVGEPPYPVSAWLFGLQEPLTSERVQSLARPGPGKAEFCRHFPRRQRGIRMRSEYLQYFPICDRRFPTSHAPLVDIHQPGLLYHCFGNCTQTITNSRPESGSTPKTITHAYHSQAKTAEPRRANLPSPRTGPKARRSWRAMKASHNRTETDGRNVYSSTAFSADAPDRAAHERQLRAIVDRHPLEVDE